ncbi:hypothetical protein [Streptomyces sp. NPDC007088]|uniref:hypothetical protein n=1 Tax=Streptomyces sp. NPDC007088 TaxID=3364773 RepID=UPI003689B3B3
MLSIPAHVRWGRCRGGTAVLDLRAGRWHMFSGTGARVWDAVALRGGLSGLAEEIAVPGGLNVAAARRAVDAYLAALLDMGLLTRSQATTGGPRARGCWRRRR